MGIKNRAANIETGWEDHNSKHEIKNITVDGHKINIDQFKEAEHLTVNENGTYRGLFDKVEVEVSPDVETQNVFIDTNGTYYPTPGKYIEKVEVQVFDTPFATEDIDWSEVLR